MWWPNSLAIVGNKNHIRTFSRQSIDARATEWPWVCLLVRIVWGDKTIWSARFTTLKKTRGENKQIVSRHFHETLTVRYLRNIFFVDIKVLHWQLSAAHQTIHGLFLNSLALNNTSLVIWKYYVLIKILIGCHVCEHQGGETREINIKSLIIIYHPCISVTLVTTWIVHVNNHQPDEL